MLLKRWTGVATVCLALGMPLGLGASAAMAGEPVVLELFTSQGCSSCPPADALMRDLRSDPNVIALTLPVDYWDYLGWKDTLASPANTQRQQAYARARGDRQVYTPQMVVNGVQHAVGSNLSAIKQAARSSRSKIGTSVPVSITGNDASIELDVGAAPSGSRAKKGTVWLVLYEDSEQVSIKRGENAGRKVTYYNVVKEMTPLGMWTGSAVHFALPRTDLKARGYEKCAVLLQAGNAGPIIGAAELKGL